MSLGRWLCSHFQLKTPLNLFSQADNSKTIQFRAVNLTSLDSLSSCESIFLYIKSIKLVKHELNHFKDNWNTILDLFWSLTSDHEMARVTRI